MIVKRFVLMGGAKYYACGGFEDYLNSFDTKDEAIAARDKWLKEQEDSYHWAHVADLETGEYWSYGRAEAGLSRFMKEGSF
jgi:hypothetical protein